MKNTTLKELVCEKFPEYDDRTVEETVEVVQAYTAFIMKQMAIESGDDDAARATIIPKLRDREPRVVHPTRFTECDECRVTLLDGSVHYHGKRQINPKR